MAGKSVFLNVSEPIQRFGGWRKAAEFDEKLNKPIAGSQRRDEDGNPVWIADFVQAGAFGAQVITVTTASATVPSFDRLALVDSRRTSAAPAKPGFGLGGDVK